MKHFFWLFWLSLACVAQSPSTQFREEYERALAQNPPGLEMTISTVGGKSSYHLGEPLRLKLTFTSSRWHRYTVELVGPASVAGASPDFVIGGPGIPSPIHSQRVQLYGIICCNTKRRYVERTPVSAPELRIVLREIERAANARAGFPQILPSPPFSPPVKMQPGEYSIFAQTRSVMRGWPKNSRDEYHSVSDFVLTSSNILHITALPDIPQAESRQPGP